MNPSEVLLGLSLVVIVGLSGVIVYLSRRKPAAETPKEAPPTPPSTAIHEPAPLLQPGLGINDTEEPKYRLRKYFLSYQERKIYDALCQMVEKDLTVFAQVRMAELVELANHPKNGGRYINYILTRHIDFVVCDMRPDTPQVLVGIELDDSTHKRYDRTESDKFKNSVFEQIGLPLLRIPVQSWTVPSVKGQLEEALVKNSGYMLRNKRPSITTP